MSSPSMPNDRAFPGPGSELGVRWRTSRHARRLLTLALAGVFVATLARRPEFAGLAAPALLLLAAGQGQRRLVTLRVKVRASAGRAFEGEVVAVDVAADLGSRAGDFAVRWTLHPGREIDPVGATDAAGRTTRFTVTPQHWAGGSSAPWTSCCATAGG